MAPLLKAGGRRLSHANMSVITSGIANSSALSLGFATVVKEV